MEIQAREIRGLKTKIYHALMKLNNTKSSIQVLNNLHASCNFLNNVQYMKQEERQIYYECFEYLTDFLRRHRQLERTQKGFDPDVTAALNNMLCRLQSLSYGDRKN